MYAKNRNQILIVLAVLYAAVCSDELAGPISASWLLQVAERFSKKCPSGGKPLAKLCSV